MLNCTASCPLAVSMIWRTELRRRSLTLGSCCLCLWRGRVHSLISFRRSEVVAVSSLIHPFSAMTSRFVWLANSSSPTLK